MKASDIQHLLYHFTPGRMWLDGDMTVFVRGEGCYIWDEDGKKYLDGLAGLFVVQIGHGRSDLANAAAKQMEQLSYTPTWAAVHPTAVDAAKLITSLAPGDLDTVFFVSSGSEAVDSAIKFARQHHRNRGNHWKTGVISRDMSYHGTTLGALSVTGLESIREPFHPLLPNMHKVGNTLQYPDANSAVQAFEDKILQVGPENIAMISAEPVQNGGGAIVPPDGYWEGLRRLCDKYDILLHADEVINAFGRLGRWFGSDLVGVVPDLITFAKGATSGYAPIGGLLIRRPHVEALMKSEDGTFTHGATWGGHPMVMAVAIANILALRDEHILENVVEHEDYFRGELDRLADAHSVVTDVRGAGYFYAVELGMPDGEPMNEKTTKKMVNEVLPRYISDAGLLIRADSRGQAKLMLSPPLIARTTEIDELLAGVDQIVTRFAKDLS